MVVSFRYALCSLLLRSFEVPECHNILPCELTSTPLAEPDL